MRIAETILPEFVREMANTAKVLEHVPEDKLDWKARPEMNSIGWNANHLAEIPSWVAGTLSQDAWDIAPPDGPPYKSPALTSKREILELFHANVTSARQALESATDQQMQQNWSLLKGGETLMTMPRADVIRTWVLNHIIHHRAHLIVYLRLNDITVPGMYGPS